MRHAVYGVFILFAATAAAQDAPPRRAQFRVPPSDVDVLLGAQAVLHTADMLTTAYDLTLSPDAHEGNPILGAFGQQPVRLAIVSGAIDILLTYTIEKLQQRHPKIARWWALALVGTEAWTTLNNISAAGQLQRRRAGRGQ
jgi:hypothetical protein